APPAMDIVPELLQLFLVRPPLLPTHLRYRVAGGIERLQRAQERGMFLWLRRQFHEQRLLHRTSVLQLSSIVIRRLAPPPGGSAFLPGLKARGFLRRVL